MRTGRASGKVFKPARHRVHPLECACEAAAWPSASGAGASAPAGARQIDGKRSWAVKTATAREAIGQLGMTAEASCRTNGIEQIVEQLRSPFDAEKNEGRHDEAACAAKTPPPYGNHGRRTTPRQASLSRNVFVKGMHDATLIEDWQKNRYPASAFAATATRWWFTSPCDCTGATAGAWS